MKLYNTVNTFLESADRGSELSLSQLYKYYDLHPESFEEYFPNHCPKTDERLLSAIERYNFEQIKDVSSKLPAIIKEILGDYEQHFGVAEDLAFHLLVGGYGSNAFVNRQIIGDVYFAVEKLSPNPDHLRVITAHELGHIYHNILSDQHGLAWKNIDWLHGLNSLYREGIATYLSMQIVKDLPESIYYSYIDEGEEWLNFCYNHIGEIAGSFLEDCSSEWNTEKEREWFRLSGGHLFGYNRLGYFLGTQYVREYAESRGEMEAILAWKTPGYFDGLKGWLRKKAEKITSGK